ncbi:MAG: YtfJ family protein [Halioglobus sp.]
MTLPRVVLSFALALACAAALASAPAVNAPLPVLNISERGELTMSGDDFTFIPWRSDSHLGKVQVVQYFGATMGDSKIFKPFTDLLAKSFEPGVVQVTTILNLDAAMWGTTGMVVSELQKNKRLHPQATMVVDDKGRGVAEWGLDKSGAGLFIIDDKGTVKYFTQQAMSDNDLTAALAVVRANLDG